ncbi:sugar phosphate nucleotidyltransferase [Chloroflexota bacterium]
MTKFVSAYSKEYALVGVYDIGEKAKARHFGVVQLHGYKIIEFDEKPVEPESTLVATACYLLPARVFPMLSEFIQKHEADNLGSFIVYLTNVDEVHAYTFSEPWLDIGSINAYYST